MSNYKDVDFFVHNDFFYQLRVYLTCYFYIVLLLLCLHYYCCSFFQINSYGGTLTYSFSYNNSYHLDSIPTNHPDIILQGNDKTLIFNSRSAHPEAGIKHTVEARLDEVIISF